MLPWQDAHEFLNYLLNEAAELLEKRLKKAKGEHGQAGESEASGSDYTDGPPLPYKAKTWIHSIFEGEELAWSGTRTAAQPPPGTPADPSAAHRQAC